MVSIEDARTKIVDEEVSSVLRESHVEHFAYLEKKLGIPLRDLDIWPEFVELTQRRHLIAHTDGRVSAQYLQVCSSHNVKVDERTVVGDVLHIDEKYFLRACDCLTELGVKLSQVVWRKLDKTTADEAEYHLLRRTFDMIEAGQYQPAIRILSFALKPPMKITDARTRCMCVINLAQSHKWAGDNKRAYQILDGEDWSEANLDFRLAVAVIKDDFEEAGRLMRRIGNQGEVDKEAYEKWPLFKEFRKSDAFVKAYSDIFKSEIEVEGMPGDLQGLLAKASTEMKAAAEASGGSRRNATHMSRKKRAGKK